MLVICFSFKIFGKKTLLIVLLFKLKRFVIDLLVESESGLIFLNSVRLVNFLSLISKLKFVSNSSLETAASKIIK